MAKYLDAAKAAKKAGQGTKVGAPKWKPENKGDMLAGLLIEKETAHSQQFGSDFVVYTFMTDDGPRKWIPGQATDAEIKSLMQTGQIYLVEFLGKEKTNTGNDRNSYEVTEIPGDVMAGI